MTTDTPKPTTTKETTMSDRQLRFNPMTDPVIPSVIVGDTVRIEVRSPVPHGVTVTGNYQVEDVTPAGMTISSGHGTAFCPWSLIVRLGITNDRATAHV